MKLDIEVKLSLAYLGDGWEDCYINFTPVSIGEAKKMRSGSQEESALFDAGIELIKSKFVSGKVLSGGKTVGIKAEDIEDMPVSVIEGAVELLVSSLSKKK